MSRVEFGDRRFARDPSVVSRRIVDEVLLVPIRRRAADVDHIFTLNAVGARVWELLDGVRRVSEVGAAIASEYEVGEDEAVRDVADLLRQLEALGAVRES